MLRAGDRVRALIGERTGDVLEIVKVRMFATDRGYYLHGGEGLYGPDQVALVASRDGNPCRVDCDPHIHDRIGVCDHCLGACQHA